MYAKQHSKKNLLKLVNSRQGNLQVFVQIQHGKPTLLNFLHSKNHILNFSPLIKYHKSHLFSIFPTEEFIELQ